MGCQQLTYQKDNFLQVVHRKNGQMQKKNALDYFSGGMAMPNRNNQSAEGYRYGYQGEFAETDPETGKPMFELRLYDPRINRWLTTDPYGQYHSPYVGMGNDWVNCIDPDGGWKTKIGQLWAWGRNGFRGSLFKSDVETGNNKFGIDLGSNDMVFNQKQINISALNWKYDYNGSGFVEAGVSQFKPNLSGRINESGIAGAFAYDFANGFYTTSQMFIGRSVGDSSMRNLDGTSTTTDQGIMGFVGTATFGYGKYASSLKYLKPIKSSPKLWNIYQSSTKGIFNSRTSAANAYKIQIKSLNNMISNHNGLIKPLQQSSNATGYTQNTSSIIDYYINKD